MWAIGTHPGDPAARTHRTRRRVNGSYKDMQIAECTPHFGRARGSPSLSPPLSIKTRLPGPPGHPAAVAGQPRCRYGWHVGPELDEDALAGLKPASREDVAGGDALGHERGGTDDLAAAVEEACALPLDTTVFARAAARAMDAAGFDLSHRGARASHGVLYAQASLPLTLTVRRSLMLEEDKDIAGLQVVVQIPQLVRLGRAVREKQSDVGKLAVGHTVPQLDAKAFARLPGTVGSVHGPNRRDSSVKRHPRACDCCAKRGALRGAATRASRRCSHPGHGPNTRARRAEAVNGDLAHGRRGTEQGG